MLQKFGWLISLRKSTISTEKFTFQGLTWNIKEMCSGQQNARLDSILSHRIPRSTADLSSRISTIAYYGSFIPALKRIALMLYNVMRTGIFKWGKAEAHAYSDLVHLSESSNQELDLQV